MANVVASRVHVKEEMRGKCGALNVIRYYIELFFKLGTHAGFIWRFACNAAPLANRDPESGYAARDNNTVL